LHVHVAAALAAAHTALNVQSPEQALLRSLLHIVRWEIGIGYPEFMSNDLEGEKWLAWAAGNVCLTFFISCRTLYTLKQRQKNRPLQYYWHSPPSCARQSVPHAVLLFYILPQQIDWKSVVS
jgi:hypothetical protein